jgi:ABC-type oligopeptide transport system substrate-binding subunit
LWTRASEHNKTGWASNEYDNFLAQAAETPDPTGRFDLLRRAESVVLREAPITPLFYLPSYELRRPRVKGWQINPLSQHPLKFVTIEP